MIEGPSGRETRTKAGCRPFRRTPSGPERSGRRHRAAARSPRDRRTADGDRGAFSAALRRDRAPSRASRRREDRAVFAVSARGQAMASARRTRGSARIGLRQFQRMRTTRNCGACTIRFFAWNSGDLLRLGLLVAGDAELVELAAGARPEATFVSGMTRKTIRRNGIRRGRRVVAARRGRASGSVFHDSRR